KVRIKCGKFASERGVLTRPHSGKWIVSMREGSLTAILSSSELTNFSLAARRAWRSMPDRKVGRPAGSKVSDRISVIFRVDRPLWNQFLAAEDAGLIGDRTTVINACLRDALSGSRRLQPKAS